MTHANTTPRDVFAGTVALAAMPAAAATPDALRRELLALETCRARLDSAAASGASIPTAEWEAWGTAEEALLERVEALPAVRANAAIKARAVSMIYHDGLDQMFEDTTDARLCRQIVRALSERHS